jgi:MFS family permease
MTETPAVKLATRLVLLSVLATGMGQSMTFALLAPLGREAGFSVVQIGTVITCSSLMFTLSSPVWGRTCDRWGRRPVLLIGQFGYAFGVLLFAATFSTGMSGLLAAGLFYPLAIGSRVLMALLMSAAPSAAAAYIADTTSAAKRTAGMGRLGAARTLGAILGPAVGGALAVFGLLTPLYCAGGIAMISALALAAVVREPVRRITPGVKRARLKLFDRRYFPFILVGFVTFLGFSMMSQTIGFYFQDRFHLDGPATAQILGLGLMVSAGASLLAQALLVQRLRLTPPQLLKSGLPLLIVGFALLPVADSQPLLVAIMGIIGLGMGLIGPGFTAGASLAVGPDEQGAVGGLVSACPSSGFVLGPLVGTALYQYSPTLPYLCAGALMVPLLIYASRIQFRPDQTENP